jgi:hypothetical protein
VALTRALASLLFGVQPNNLASYVATSALVLGIGLLASYLPALRATRIDPLAALRSEPSARPRDGVNGIDRAWITGSKNVSQVIENTLEPGSFFMKLRCPKGVGDKLEIIRELGNPTFLEVVSE